MPPTLQQDIRVRIDTVFTSLPQVEKFVSLLQRTKQSDQKKLSFGSTSEINALTISIEKLVAAVNKIDEKQPTRLGQSFRTLAAILQGLESGSGALDFIRRLTDLQNEAPQIAARLQSAATAVRSFFTGVGEKVAAGVATAKTKVTELAADLPAFTKNLGAGATGLLGLGAAGTVATAGLAAVAGLILAVIAAAVALPALASLLLPVAAAASETGSKFHDLSQQTGASVEVLSALAPVLEDSSSDLDQFASAIGRFNKKIGEAAASSEEAAADLELFGLTPQEALNDLDGALEKVFQRIIALPDGNQRAIAAQKAFGKSGAELVPTILATGGSIADLKKKAIELGVYWTGPGAAAADEYGDLMNTLNRIVAGFKLTLGQGLIPELLKLARIFAHEMPRSGGAFAGVLRYILSWVISLRLGVVSLIAAAKTLGELPGILARTAGAGVFGGPAAATEISRTFLRNYDELQRLGNQPVADEPTAVPLDFGKAGGGGGSGRAGANEPPDTLESLLGFDRARAESLFNLFRAQLDRQTKTLKQSYEDRKLSIREFYAEQERLQTAALEAEIRKVQQERNIERRRLSNQIQQIESDRDLSTAEKEAQVQIANNEAQTNLVALNERLVLLYQERADLADNLGREETDATRELQDNLQRFIDLADQLRGLGPLVDARRQIAEIDDQIALLRQNGEETAADFLETLRDLLGELGQLETRIARVTTQQDILSARIDATRAQSRGNLVSEFVGELRVHAIRRQQIAAAEELLRLLEEKARLDQSPQTILALERQRAAVADLKGEYKSLARTIKDTFINSAVTGVEDFLLSLKDVFAGVKSLGDVFRQVALSIIEDISRIIARIIALKIVTAVLGALGVPADKAPIPFPAGFAAGGDIFARPGGRAIIAGEGGHDELVVTTDPRYRQRTAALLGRFIRRTGILPRFDTGAPPSASILANLGAHLPRLAAGDFIPAAPPAEFAGHGPVSLTVQNVFPNVRDARGFHLNQTAIAREAGRGIEAGLKKLRGSRD